MAKISAIVKQRKREKCVLQGREKRAELRKKIKSLNLSEEEKEGYRIALNKMKRDSSYVRLHNRCQITGRPRGFLRKFQVSRICFRQLASMGEIPGVIKASW